MSKITSNLQVRRYLTGEHLESDAIPKPQNIMPNSPPSGIRLVPYSPPRFEDQALSSSSVSLANSDSEASTIGVLQQHMTDSLPQIHPSFPLAPPADIIPSPHVPSSPPLSQPPHAPFLPQDAVVEDINNGRQSPGFNLTNTGRGTSTPNTIRPKTLDSGLSNFPVAPSAFSHLSSYSNNVQGSYSSLRSDTTGIWPRPSPLDEIDEVDEMENIEGGSPVTELHQQPPPLLRRNKAVAVHSDKTFTLIPTSRSSSSNSKTHSQQSFSHSRFPSLAYRAPPSLSVASTVASSTQGPQSDKFFDDRPNSANTTIFDIGISPCDSVSSDINWIPIDVAPSPTSPCLDAPQDSLHKVPRTPDLKYQHSDWPIIPPHLESSSSETIPPRTCNPVSAISLSSYTTSRNPRLQLTTKPSLQSIQSYSSDLDTPNYRTYQFGSPGTSSIASLDAWFSSPNRYNLDEASPTNPSSSNEESDQTENYIVHRTRSISETSLSTICNNLNLYSQATQDSLAVTPQKHVPTVSLGGHRIFAITRSCESLMRSPSLASISSYFTHEAFNAFVTTSTTTQLHRTISNGSLLGQFAKQFQPHPEPTPPTPCRAYPPDVIKSQSTPAPARQWSPSISIVGSHNESSSNVSYGRGTLLRLMNKPHANQPDGLDKVNYNRKRRPFSPFIKFNSANHTPGNDTMTVEGQDLSQASSFINHQDEDGDGLADLQELQRRPSRKLLSMQSDYNLHSSASSRVNSFNSASFPSWARLYYGSGGECKLLMPSSDSLYSAFVRDRDAQNNIHSFVAKPELCRPGGPTTQRHNSMEVTPIGLRPPPAVVSVGMEAIQSSHSVNPISIVQTGTTSHPATGFRAVVRKKTSSIWSPHLSHDRRANRHSLWVPPQNHWPVESTHVDRRNRQRVLFIIGFLFPFAWMIASFLPLPLDPTVKVQEHDPNDPNPDFRRDLARHKAQTLQEVRYRSARWWRHINRYMSIFGILVIGIIITLIIIGVHQRWGI